MRKTTLLFATALVMMSCGGKSEPSMAEMEETVRQLVEKSHHDHYVISRGSTYTDYDSTYDMHCNIVEINLIIK